jgi:GDP-mannose transporter
MFPFVKQFLSIPVYTIFKNLTIILIVSRLIRLGFSLYHSLIISQAYGEAIWFGGKVTTLTLISFIFMVSSFPFELAGDVKLRLLDPVLCNRCMVRCFGRYHGQ